jgi:hypothetical protein
VGNDDTIRSQLDLAFNPLEKRDSHGRWTRGAGFITSQRNQFLAENLPHIHQGGPKWMEVIGLNPGRHPDKGQQIRDDRGVWGVITKVAGNAAIVAMNDQHKYAIDWKKGEVKRDLGLIPRSPVSPPTAMDAWKSPKQWEFIGPHGSLAGQAFLPGNREPQLGDMARDGHGGVGRVISKGGGHVVLDADDGNRYLVDWRNGGNVVREVPLGDAPWHDPHAIPDAWLRSSMTDRRDSLRKPSSSPVSPPGVYQPGGKQLIFPDMPGPVADAGPNSPGVRRLQKLMPEVNKALEAGSSVDTPDYEDQGRQGTVSFVTLPDGTRILSKKQAPYHNDAEELSTYVSQVIGAGAPAVARDPDDDSHIIEDVVPGETAYRYTQDQAEDGRDWSGYSPNEIWDELTKGGDNAGRIGLLDYLIGNGDRHSGNVMVDESGGLTPIDQGSADFSEDSSSEFWSGDPGETLTVLREYRAGLVKLEPEFERLGLHDWYDGMIARMDDQIAERQAYEEPGGDPGDLSISGQAGIELSWKDAWLHEARDASGKWTKGLGSSGHSYELPDPARLASSRSPYKMPGDHPFFQAHPVSPAHIAQRFDEASDSERAQGMNWYADARELALKLGGGDMTKAAGVMAAYSPQTAWPVNMLNAARALAENRALGKKDGMITGAMQKNAQRALDGEPLDKVLKSPKTNDFGHLIAAGGDGPEEKLGRVVIDRHAMSVATGQRMTRQDMDNAPIDDRRYYEHVADAYRQAAAAISKREGITVTPHQLQAITWLRQQDLNENEDQAAGAVDPKLNRLRRGRETNRRNSWARWQNYDWEHNLPGEIGTTALPGNALAPQVQRSPEGFSVSMGSGKAPGTGFMVAQSDHTHTFPDSVMTDERQLADAIDAMLLAESEAFRNGNVYLGGWVHDGKLWLEPSDNVAGRAEAEALAKQRNQIAIWDVSAGQEVQTGGTGGGQIYEHASTYPEGDSRSSGGLRGPPGGGAQGRGAEARAPAPGEASGSVWGQLYDLSDPDGTMPSSITVQAEVRP